MQPPRPIAVATYSAFLIAGVSFLFWGPSNGVQVLLGDLGYVIWNVFLIVGGTIGAVGAGKGLFRVEICAIPFLFASLVVYGGSLLPRLNDSPQPGVLVGLASIFFGAALGFLGTGVAIWVHKIRIARDVERRSEDGQ